MKISLDHMQFLTIFIIISHQFFKYHSYRFPNYPYLYNIVYRWLFTTCIFNTKYTFLYALFLCNLLFLLAKNVSSNFWTMIYQILIIMITLYLHPQLKYDLYPFPPVLHLLSSPSLPLYFNLLFLISFYASWYDQHDLVM